MVFDDAEGAEHRRPAPRGDFGDDHIVRQLGSILRGAIPGLRQNGSTPRDAEGGQRDTSSAGVSGSPEST